MNRFRQKAGTTLACLAALGLLSLAPTRTLAVPKSAIGTNLTRETACADAKMQADKLAFIDNMGRVSWYGGCSCVQTNTNYWRCDLPFEYHPGSSRSGGGGGGGEPSWAKVGDPDEVEVCAAAYAMTFKLHGASSPREGKALTDATAMAGRDAARSEFYALKNRLESGAVSVGAVSSFTAECDRRHGLGFNG